MSLLFPEIIDPSIPLEGNKTPCVVPPSNPLEDMMKMIQSHTGYTVGFPKIRNGYWEVESMFGRIRISDLLKTKKGCVLY